ncbi:hypothetical protein IIA79_04660 [bacterium]|nr:hypothetical protein [bacterium]
MEEQASQALPIHYLPLATTLISAVFLAVLIRRYFFKGYGAHLLWWAAGILSYGLGTALEGAITLFGNSIALTKAWYVAGAVLGGYPLAQGSIYLLLPRHRANLLTTISLPVIMVVSTLVLISPVIPEALEPHRPSGSILGWQWVRLLTPFINGYAAFFLIGLAIRSAYLFFMHRRRLARAIGNSLIAVGAILPGIGGGMAKAGAIEALYLGEFIGVILIWAGYTACVWHADAELPSQASQQA